MIVRHCPGVREAQIAESEVGWRGDGPAAAVGHIPPSDTGTLDLTTFTDVSTSSKAKSKIAIKQRWTGSLHDEPALLTISRYSGTQVR